MTEILKSKTTPAFGGAIIQAKLKAKPADFLVTERLDFEPSGEGEHIYCWVEKEGVDTAVAAKLLAKHADISPKHVSYAGLKDKQAITKQWFSLHIPGKREVDWQDFNGEQLKVITSKRHNKKLQRGALKGNAFQIKLTELAGDLDALPAQLERLKQGLPNYFGHQRFGYNGNNLLQAQAFLLQGKKVKGKQLKGLLYSATRSALFNQYLSARVEAGSWHKIVKGDVVCLQGSHSYFIAEDDLDDLAQRLSQKDVAPGGLLWGKLSGTKLQSCADAFSQVCSQWSDYMAALVAHNLEMAVRPLMVFPEQLEWQIEGNSLLLSFSLPKGSYATTLINEIVRYRE